MDAEDLHTTVVQENSGVSPADTVTSTVDGLQPVAEEEPVASLQARHRRPTIDLETQGVHRFTTRCKGDKRRHSGSGHESSTHGAREAAYLALALRRS